MDLTTFMKHLHTYRAPRVFNPWREYEPGLDISPEAPDIRYHNLQRYLELRRSVIIICSGIWNFVCRPAICLLRKAWAIRGAVFPAWP